MTQSTEENRGWLLPPREKKKLPAALYLVATPIGNLRDMTVRALDVLAGVDGVLCEDTRVSGKLLKAYGIKQKLSVYNDFTKEAERARFMERIQGGEALALVSDAGTPLVSDPGYKLVEACLEGDVQVVPVPGASAVLSALQLSGAPSDAFSFIGFLPSKSKARRDMLMRWCDVGGALVTFETAPRLAKALTDIADILGQRQICVAREITKMYEQAVHGTPAELIARYEADGLPKGEIVLVISPAEQGDASVEDIKAMLVEMLPEFGTKEAAAQIAERVQGWSRKEIYAVALEIAK